MSSRIGLAAAREKVYTVARMRCYVIAAGTLLCVVSAGGQQNVVPPGVLDGAIQRALDPNHPHFYPLPVVSGQKPMWFSTPGKQNLFLTGPPNVCAIPLLPAPIQPTHDRIAHNAPATRIDPKMARAVGLPPCPKP